MEFPMLQKIFILNVPINTSMLNEISDRLKIALGYAFPAYLLECDANRNTNMKRMMGCQKVCYADATVHRLKNIIPDLSEDLPLSFDNFKLKKNSFVIILK
jgi:hypothetical protein